MSQFRGLSGSAKAKQLCAGIDCSLAYLASDRPSLERLRLAMCEAANPVKPESLGVIGEAHLLESVGERVVRHWYKKVTSNDPARPFVFEVLAGEIGDGFGFSLYGVNNSVAYEDPYSGSYFNVDCVGGMGIDGLFHGFNSGSPMFVITHLVCPCLIFKDRGKSHLDLGHHAQLAIQEALGVVLKTWAKEHRQRIKNASKADRQAEQRLKETARDHTVKHATMKEIVFEVMPQAVKNGTGGGKYPISARSLYYQVRPLIQPHTDKDLTYSYFGQLLTEYQQEQGAIQQLYYDPRGWLIEPHTGNETKLGTREVEQYEIPPNLYDKILFVEKKGLWPVIRHARLAERYDMAILASEGFATEAARVLLARAQQGRDYKIFVLHDADHSGYNIARTVAEETAEDARSFHRGR